MSGELQTIPARHGAATFVPRGRTIKVINTYGKQVVSMWAFALGAPPEEGDEDEPGEEELKEEAKKLQEAADRLEGKGEGNEEEEKTTAGDQKEGSKSGNSKEEDGKDSKAETNENSDTSKSEEPKEEFEDPPEQAPDTPENEKSTENTEASKKTAKQPSKRTWASYLPSIPYRSKGKDTANKSGAKQEPSPEEKKAQDDAITKKWSSYMPTGKSFSSYIPNVEVPSKEGVVSAFKSSHYRDPNKSYAEQLYDFSKTPVGAGTIAAATGSGYASSVYAAYSAYTSTHPSSTSQPPMEYLSLPHTRASSYKLVPEVNDTLLTNLRNPIVTLVEDTTPGAHDTLTAACDANLYTALGVDKPAEHGSCAENLVLALKQLNEEAGFKGAKAVGADISVNIAPTPLHLFMVTPISLPSDDIDPKEAGAKGAKLAVEEPMGKKRGFVRFKAERDIVVVFSACPMDVGKQNGGKCMAANFMVEEAETDDAASIKSKSGKPKKLNAAGKQEESKGTASKEASSAGVKEKSGEAAESKDKATEKPKPKPKKLNAPNDKGEDVRAEREIAETSKTGGQSAAPEQSEQKPEVSEKSSEKGSDAPSEEGAKQKKKPKKLQMRAKQ